MKRRWLRLLLITCGIIAIVLVSAFILLQTPPVSRFILSQAQKYLHNESGIDFHASRMSFDLLKRTVTLENVTVRSASAPDLPPIFQSPNVFLKLGILRTGRGFPDVEELRITAPQIRYFVGRDGRTNIPTAASSSGSEQKFLIAHAGLTDGSFRWEDNRQEIELILPRWQLSLDGNRLTLDHHINFETRQAATFRYGDRSIPIDALQFLGILKRKELEIELAKIDSVNSQVSTTGSLKNFSKPEINLRLMPNLDLLRILQALGSSEKVRGNLSGTVVATGELQDLKIAAQLKGSGISAWTYREASFDFNTRAEWNSRRVLLRGFELNSPEGSLNGNAEFFPGQERGINSVKAKLRNLNIYPVWGLLKPPFDIASRGTGDISLRWKGSLDALALDADAQISLAAARTTPGRNILPLGGKLNAQLRSGRLGGTLQTFSVMGSRIDGSFSLLSFETLVANLQGSTANVEVPLAQVSQFIGHPDSSLIGIRMAGPLQFNAQVTGKLGNPKIVVSAEAPDLTADKLTNLNLKTDATIQDSQVAFQGTVTTPQNSIVSARGAFGFGGNETTLNLDAHTDSMSAADALSLLGADIPATGNLKAQVHLDGPLDSPTGNGSVIGDQFSVYREPLGHFDMDLRISGGAIQSNQFRIFRDPANPAADYIDARFRYRVSSGEFQFQAAGKDLNLPSTGPGRQTLEGTVDLISSGSGTIAQPSIDVRIESQNIRALQNSIGPISVTAALRNEQATIEALAPRLNLSSTVHVATSDPYPFDGELEIRNSDLGLLGLKAPNKQPLTGTVLASLKGSGNLKDVADAGISARIDKLEVHAGDLEAHTEGPVQAEYRDKSIEFPATATVVSGNSRVQLAGKIPLRESASSSSLRLNGQIDLAQAAGFLTVPKGFAVTGILNVDLSLAGTPKQVNTMGTITLDNGVVQLPRFPVPLSDITIRASLKDGSLILDRAEATLQDGKIALQGEFPFGLLPGNLPVQFPRKDGPVRFSLDLANFNPEMTGSFPQGVSGLVSIHASGEAARMDLRALRARIDFRDLNLKAGEIAIGQNGPSAIIVQDGIASISRLSLTGTETSIDIKGSAGLYPGGPLNLSLLGDFDAALLTLVTGKDLKVAGRLQVQVAAGGNLLAPTLTGTANMNGGRMTLREPRVVADSLTVRLDLTPSQIAVREFRGTLNGGSLNMDGTIGYHDGSLNNFNLKATFQDVFLNFPEGLKSASNGNLTITSSDESIIVGGNIRGLESSYREPLDATSQVMKYLRSQRVVVETGGPSAFLNRIRFNIGLRTDTPLLVQNNVAKLEATANLTIVGAFSEPSLVGRITLNQGGEIILNQRTYYIESGTITLTDQTEIRPELDIQATTKIDIYDITLRLTGPLEKFSPALTSEPVLQEQDIISLILTGKLSSQSTQQVARTQALSLIAGQAGEEVAREARQALHLSTFRIDPGGLIASESDLGARLTLGEDITRNFSLAYSMSLVNGGEQIWAGQYNVTRAFKTQATKQQDNSYRFEFRHDLRFGGASSTRSSRAPAPKFTIGSIHFEGLGAESDKTLLDTFKLKPGDKYDFPKVQKGLDRLHDFYAGQKRLEAGIRLHRETQQKTVDLDVTVDPGPVVEFSYEGMPLPGGIKEKVEKAWRNGVFDTERLDDAIAEIRRPLLQEGYLQCQIAPTIDTQDQKKTVHFHIEPGTKYSAVSILFPGASQISARELNTALDRANLKLDIYADPQKVTDYLKQYYVDRGYLQARVETSQPHLDAKAGTGEVLIPIKEGTQFTIGNLEFSGNAAFEYDQLWIVIPTSTGSIYNPGSLQDAVRTLENLYHSKGYNDVTIAYRILEDPKTAHANVTFQVTERRQSIIREIVIEGNRDTNQNFVQRQLDFKKGDRLDFSRIDETRKRLYSTGVFTSVDFVTEDIPATTPNPRERDIRIRIRVREIRPYRLQYGLFWDTDRGPGGLMEVQNLNVLGRAAISGVKLRYDTDLKEARLYFNQPFVTNLHLKLDASAFAQTETRTAFSANRIGFSLFREKALGRRYVFDYGYRYDHVRWKGLPPDPTIFQEASVPVGRLIATVTRDTRDSILDATRGEFTSHSFEFGPTWLGSEIGFMRYSGQYFRYVPLDKYLGKPTKDAEGKRIPASLIYAGALRLGLTSAFGGKSVISPERFFAGGGTTMRGFQQDLLGPVELQSDGTRRPLGGEALFLFNNEIRFPIIGILQGVGFVDIGNVYPQISDFNFSLRKTAGAGLRIKIKFVPLRFDYGFKLDRRPGESQGAFFFSIGQAF